MSSEKPEIHIPQPPPGSRGGPPAATGPAANPAQGLPASAPSQPSATELVPERFAEAWINSEHTVCARRLPAYSLHTHLMLCVAKNPFAFEALPAGYQITWEDLWEAVILVSTPYGAPVRWPAAWRCVFTQRLRRMRLADEVAKFRAWQNDFLCAPEVFCTEGDGRELTAPGILARVVFLGRHLNDPTEKIWTMPIGQALWSHAAVLEQINENVSLLDDEKGRLFAYIKKMQEGSGDPADIPGEPVPSGDRLARARAAFGFDPEQS